MIRYKLGSSISVLVLTAVLAGPVIAAQSDSPRNTESHDFHNTCPVFKGDTIASVQSLYKIRDLPENMNTGFSPRIAAQFPVQSSYHLPQYGIWIFFNSSGEVNRIQLDEPYKGKIRGVGIGATAAQVASTKGEPQQKFDGLYNSTAWTYGSGDDWVRYEIDNTSNLVQTIMFNTCPRAN